MHALEVPHALAGLRVERHQRLGEQVGAGPMAAVEVVGRRAERQVDVAELFVGRHVRPHVGAAGVGPRIVAPRLVAELALLRNRMNRPQPLAGAHVEAADVAARPFLVRRAVVNAGADDDHVAADDRRRAHRVIGRAHRVARARPSGRCGRPRRTTCRARRSSHRSRSDTRRACRAAADRSCHRSSTTGRDARSQDCRAVRSSSCRDRAPRSSGRSPGLIAAICPSDVTV